MTCLDSTRRAGVAALTALLMAALAPVAGAGTAAQEAVRLVVATNVVCRDRPDPEAPVRHRYGLGDEVHVRDSADTAVGTWHLDGWRVRGEEECWVHGSLTAPWDRDDAVPALLAAADRVLGRTGQVPFADYVAVDNLLVRTAPPGATDSTWLDRSPLLQLRRLQVIDAALRAPDAHRAAVEADPLKAAWMLAHRELVQYFEPAGQWVMDADIYWRLFERHRDSAAAEEIAWAGARGSVPGDECYAQCILEAMERTWARYWTAFPAGAHAGDAVAEATAAARAVLEVCDPDFSDAAATAALAGRIRESLTGVAAPGAPQLLDALRRLERECA